MATRYIRADKETRMARLGVIEEGDIVNFIDDAMHEKLVIMEKEREERILQKEAK